MSHKNFRSFLGFLIPSIFLVMLANAAAPSTWQIAAKRLTGESDAVRQASLRELAALPDLDAQLLAAIEPAEALKTYDLFFNSTRSLAIDVTLALKRRALLPALWKSELSRDPKRMDPTGTVLQAAIALTPDTPADLDTLRKNLIAIAIDNRAATARRLVALDALGRVRQKFEKSHALIFLEEKSPIPEAWMTLARQRILGLGNPEDLDLIRPAFEHEDPWIRKRAASIASELTGTGRRKLARELLGCPEPECKALITSSAGELRK